MDTKQILGFHKCEYDVPRSGDYTIIRVCLEVQGRFWVGDAKGASQVNYCPFCGVKAPIQIDLVPLDKPPSEEDKTFAALIEDVKNNPFDPAAFTAFITHFIERNNGN